MKKMYSLFLLMFFTSAAFAQTAIVMTNDGTTGTTLNELAIVNSSLNAIAAGTSNTTNPVYIVVGGAGTSGQAQLATSGPASCIMDSTVAPSAGWYYVINSTTTAKECHAQSAAPSAGTFVIGYLSSTSTTLGVAAQVVVSSYTVPGSGSSACTATAAGDICYYNGSSWAKFAGNASGTQYFSENASGVPAWGVPSGSISGLTTGYIPKAASGTTIGNSLADDGITNANGFTYGGSAGYFGKAYTSTDTVNNASVKFGTGSSGDSTCPTPASGVSYLCTKSSGISASINNAAYSPIVTTASLTGPTFPTNAQTATYQVLAADFAACKTIPVASGTFTITLVASGSQPATGQCVDVINYGTGVVTIARSGQNINGGTSSLTVAAGSATAPTGAHVVSDGTNYVAALWGGSSGGGGVPSITNASAGAPLGIDTTAPVVQAELTGTQVQDVPYSGTVTFGSTCSATATSCTISGGTALPANGGVVLASFGNGSNNQEFICYSAATSTTLTIGGGNCQTPGTVSGRGYWNTGAASHNGGDQIAVVLAASMPSVNSTPYFVQLGNGANSSFGFGLSNMGQFGGGIGYMIGETVYFLNGPGWCFTRSAAAGAGSCASWTNGSLEWTNNNNNTAIVTAGGSLDYSIATQAITATTLTAITNAFTPQMPNNGTTAAAGTGGVLSTHCKIIWNQATGGTVKFGVAASAAPTDIWVLEQDSPGAYVAPTYTTITSTTTTQTSGTITPSAFGTTYASDLWISMNPGNSNSPSIQLYALTSSGSDTLTIEPGSGCTGWN